MGKQRIAFTGERGEEKLCLLQEGKKGENKGGVHIEKKGGGER